MTADLRRLVKKIVETLKIPYTVHAAKKSQRKRNVYAVMVTFYPCAVLTPLNHLLPHGACGVLWAT